MSFFNFTCNERPRIEGVIRDQYPFLNDAEIQAFIKLYPHLKREKNFSVIDQNLEEYFKNLVLKYNNILESIQRTKRQWYGDRQEEAVPITTLNMDKKSNPTGKENQKNYNQDNFEEKPSYDTKQSEHARFLASRHEERLNKKYNSHVSSQKNTQTLQQLQQNLPNTQTNTIQTQNKEVEPVSKVQENAQLILADPISTDNQNVEYQNTQDMSIVSKQAYIENSFFNKRKERENRENTRSKMQDQVEEYRQNMREKLNEGKSSSGNKIVKETLPGYQPQSISESLKDSPQKSVKRQMTGRELEDMRIEEEKIKFGLRALELTNEFRAQNGRGALTWSQELCDIGMVHSKNMADGKVPVSHEGFQWRCMEYKQRGLGPMSENVAYSCGSSDPPKMAVDGWINSPGHRKNLLSYTNVCGIACYRDAEGGWYFTQLFN